MAAPLLLSCGLNEPSLPRFTFIKEESGADGSFILNCIFSQRLKSPDCGIVFACLHHSLDHYNNAGIRLGYSLNTFKEKNTIRTIEPLLDIFNNFPSSIFMENGFIDKFWNLIKSNVQEILTTKSKAILVIDDLSFLLNMGVTANKVLDLCEKILELTNEIPSLSVVVKMNTTDVYPTICNNIDDYSNLEIVVERLKSGSFKEVDGKLVITKKFENDIFSNKSEEKTVLYKVNDRNVKIFVPGEIGVQF